MNPKLIQTLREETAALQSILGQFLNDLDLIEKVADLAWNNATTPLSDSEVRSLLKRIVKEGGWIPGALHRQIAAMEKQLENISRKLTEEHPPDEGEKKQ